MTVGAMAMTLSQSSIQVSGGHQIHPDQNKRSKLTQVSRRCWFLFWCWWEFVPPGNNNKSAVLLECVATIAWEPTMKSSAKWQSGDWFLHHDNDPAHTALSVQQFFAKNKMVVVSHHPYLPDCASCDYFLYPRMKQYLKGRHFADVAEVQQESLAARDSISVQDFRQCFRQWEQCWDRCGRSKGGYFEGD